MPERKPRESVGADQGEVMDDLIVALVQTTIEELIAFADKHQLDRNEVIQKAGFTLYSAGQIGDFTNYKGGDSV